MRTFSRLALGAAVVAASPAWSQGLDEAALSNAGGAQVDTPGIRPPLAPKREFPDWARAAGSAPVPEEIEQLAEKVRRAPRDRAARARHGYALARAGFWGGLRDACLDWQRFDPSNPSVYELLGEAFAGLGDPVRARRARWSIAEVSPGDAGLLDRAGFLALRGGDPESAAELFSLAIERRPDRANPYRGLALARWSAGDHAAAAAALRDGLEQDYDERYGDVKRVLTEELGLVLAAWRQAGGDPGANAVASDRVQVAAAPLRITLHWDTDASDVDLHVVDPSGEECFYSNKENASGLALYEDLTQGLGPEVAVVPPGRSLRGSYQVGVKYFASGPMGVSRGVVVVLRPSVAGRPAVTVLPFTLLPADEADPEQDMRWLIAVPGAP